MMNTTNHFFRTCRHCRTSSPSVYSQCRPKSRPRCLPPPACRSLSTATEPSAQLANELPPFMTTKSTTSSTPRISMTLPTASANGSSAHTPPSTTGSTAPADNGLEPNPKFTLTGTVLRTGTMDNTVIVKRNTMGYNKHLRNRYVQPVREKVHDPANLLVEGDTITYGLFPESMWEKRKEEGRLGGTKNKRGVRYILGQVVSPFGTEGVEARKINVMEEIKVRKEKGEVRPGDHKLEAKLHAHHERMDVRQNLMSKQRHSKETRRSAAHEGRRKILEAREQKRSQIKAEVVAEWKAMIEEKMVELRQGVVGGFIPFIEGEEIYIRVVSFRKELLSYVNGEDVVDGSAAGTKIQEVMQNSGARIATFAQPSDKFRHSKKAAGALIMGNPSAAEKAVVLIEADVKAGRKWLEGHRSERRAKAEEAKRVAAHEARVRIEQNRIQIKAESTAEWGALIEEKEAGLRQGAVGGFIPLIEGEDIQVRVFYFSKHLLAYVNGEAVDGAPRSKIQEIMQSSGARIDTFSRSGYESRRSRNAGAVIMGDPSAVEKAVDLIKEAVKVGMKSLAEQKKREEVQEVQGENSSAGEEGRA